MSCVGVCDWVRMHVCVQYVMCYIRIEAVICCCTHTYTRTTQSVSVHFSAFDQHIHRCYEKCSNFAWINSITVLHIRIPSLEMRIQSSHQNFDSALTTSYTWHERVTLRNVHSKVFVAYVPIMRWYANLFTVVSMRHAKDGQMNRKLVQTELTLFRKRKINWWMRCFWHGINSVAIAMQRKSNV